MTIFIQVSFLKSRDWTSKLNLCTDNFPDGHPSIKAKETGIDMPQDPEIGNLMKILWAAIFAGNFMEFSPERELYLMKLGLCASARIKQAMDNATPITMSRDVFDREKNISIEHHNGKRVLERKVEHLILPII